MLLSYEHRRSNNQGGTVLFGGVCFGLRTNTAYEEEKN